MKSPSLHDTPRVNIRHNKQSREATLKLVRGLFAMLRVIIRESEEMHPGDTLKQSWYRLKERQAFWDSIRATIWAGLVQDANLETIQIDDTRYPTFPTT